MKWKGTRKGFSYFSRLCLYRQKTLDGHYVCKHKDNYFRKCSLIKVFVCSLKELLDKRERCYGK